MLEKDGEDQLRHGIEGRREGRAELTERPGPGLRKSRAVQHGRTS